MVKSSDYSDEGGKMKYISHSYEETLQIAKELSHKLTPGCIVTLDGDLGAGKTAFTTGMVSVLSPGTRATSPTFTIVNEYLSGKVPVFHFDVYRLSSMDDLYDIGWDDYLYRKGIIIMEWANVVKNEIDCSYIEININKMPHLGENVREISIDYRGEKQ